MRMTCMLGFISHSQPPACTVCFFFFILSQWRKNLFASLPSLFKVHFAEQCQAFLPDPLINMYFSRKCLGLSVDHSPIFDPTRAASTSDVCSQWMLDGVQGQVVKLRPGRCAGLCWDHGLPPETRWLLDISLLLLSLGLQNENLSWASVICWISQTCPFLILEDKVRNRWVASPHLRVCVDGR